MTLAPTLLIDRRMPAFSLVGLVVSVTPTAVYLNSVLNPNGGEIAAVVVTLVAGEILRRNGSRLGTVMPRNLLIHLALAVGVGHMTAIWMAARRFAVGVYGHLFFLRESQWSPEFGWLSWLGLAALGRLLIVAAGVVATYAMAIGTDLELHVRALSSLFGGRTDRGSEALPKSASSPG